MNTKITDLNEFINLLNNGYTNEQLASHYNCGISTVKRFKTSNKLIGYKTNSKPLSIKDIETINSLTENGLSLQQIATKIGKSDYIIKKYLPDIIYKQIIVNSRNVFSANLVKADITPIFEPSNYSAYICGVLQSDGYLSKDGYIGLTVKDKDFAETFAKFFKTSVRTVVRDTNTYYGVSFKDIRNLEKFKSITNIYPNKTYSSYNIPAWIRTNYTFLNYFIAGVFDGDGWVYKVKDRNNILELGIEQHILSRKFLEDINEVLGWNTYTGNNTFRIHTKDKDLVKQFYTWYSQIEFIMKRKVSVMDSVYL